jgi:hypothetical protein
MLSKIRRTWYAPFLNISLITWRIILVIEAGFVGRSTQRKLGHYTADILAWGSFILLLIYIGEAVRLPITYFNVYSWPFIRNLIIMAAVSIILHTSLSELLGRIIPSTSVLRAYTRPFLIILSLIIGHDFIFTPQLLS